MNFRHPLLRPPIAAIAAAPVLLVALVSCTSYDPYTGSYEYDAGKTMAAVGTAALIGAIAVAADDDDYRRPPHHHHYYGAGPRPPGRPGPPPRPPRPPRPR